MKQPDTLPRWAIEQYATGNGIEARLARMLLEALDEVELVRATNILVLDNSEAIYDAYRRKRRKLKRLKRRLRRA